MATYLPMQSYRELKARYDEWEARKLSEIEGLGEAEIVAKIESEGTNVFWSRFGGWKFGTRDDDDVSEGYEPIALWLNHDKPQEFC